METSTTHTVTIQVLDGDVAISPAYSVMCVPIGHRLTVVSKESPSAAILALRAFAFAVLAATVPRDPDAPEPAKSDFT
jgi:hypothetical protein